MQLASANMYVKSLTDPSNHVSDEFETLKRTCKLQRMIVHKNSLCLFLTVLK